MTYYFDNKQEELRKVREAYEATADYGALAKGLDGVDEEVVRDVTLAAESPNFPKDIQYEINLTVLKYSAVSQPHTGVSPTFLDYDDAEAHIRGISDLIHNLHTLFHSLAQMELAGFTDDPRMPMRTLFDQGAETRERIVERMREEATRKAEGLPEEPDKTLFLV